MRSMPAGELNLGLLLFIPYRAMENRVLETLARAGFTDMTLARARIFQRIAPGGTRLTDLAERSQVTKQAAAALVQELEQAGYVLRKPDPDDARARLICVAERGARAVAVAATAVAETEAEWRQQIGSRRLDQLRRILEDLREITDPYA